MGMVLSPRIQRGLSDREAGTALGSSLETDQPGYAQHRGGCSCFMGMVTASPPRRAHWLLIKQGKEVVLKLGL